MNVLDYISPQYCIGCGICAYSCPSKHLEIRHNSLKQLKADRTKNKCNPKCNLCLKVCPFSDLSENEDQIGNLLYSKVINIKHQQDIGYYLNTYVGYSPTKKDRNSGASGGMTSWILKELLKRKEVDAVALVEKRAQIPYFKYTICNDYQKVSSYSRSAYYTNNIDTILTKIYDDKRIQNIAITALPCISKAIRNSILIKHKKDSKIRFIIGLVCGQTKSHNFSSYLAKKHELPILDEIDFRIKKKNRTNGNFGVNLKAKTQIKEITFSSFAKEWSFGLFTPNPCNFCDDIFAETADIALMDAWLPEYKDSDKGENLIVTRSEYFDNLLKKIATIEEIPVQRVLQSQKEVIINKRSFITERLKTAHSNKKYIPQKRDHLFKKAPCYAKAMIRTKYILSSISDELWINSNENYDSFSLKLKKYKILMLIALVINKIGNLYKKKK